MLNPPAPYQSSAIDIVAQLESLKDKTYANGYEFHESVSVLLNRLRDPHTQYIMPCAIPMYLPFQFTFKYDEASESYTVLGVRGPNSAVTKQFVHNYRTNLTGKVIVRLKTGDASDRKSVV
jgi:hypothetical protein